MRPTTGLGLAGLALVGFIIADFLIHPEGTKAAGNAINTGLKTTVQGLLGSVPK